MPLFPSTRWSVVAAARNGDASERRRALETLSAVYWRPVYTYIRIRWQRPPEEAADLAQGFFVHLLERDLVQKFDEERGRLRTYLRVAIDGFASNEFRAASRLKRGGGGESVPIHDETITRELEARLAQETAGPDEVFEREWTRSVFSVALERLRTDLTTRQKTIPLALFEISDLGTESGEAPSYADLGQRFGIKQTDVTNGLALARREFRRHVLEVLRELTGSEKEFRLELRALSRREGRAGG